jgi:hypothetical protein
LCLPEYLALDAVILSDVAKLILVVSCIKGKYFFFWKYEYMNGLIIRPLATTVFEHYGKVFITRVDTPERGKLHPNVYTNSIWRV